jgi:hypothetical protein
VLQDLGDRRRWRPTSTRICVPIPGKLYGLVVAAVVLGVLGAIFATAPFGGHAAASRELNSRAHEPGPAGVAAAYGYPTRCLSVTISSIDPAFARADFNHASPCGRYAGYPTAIFHRVGREWRPLLEAVSYPCPAQRIPPAIQTELGVCPGTTPWVPSHHP